MGLRARNHWTDKNWKKGETKISPKPPRMMDEAQGLLIYSNGDVYRAVRQLGPRGNLIGYEYHYVSNVKEEITRLKQTMNSERVTHDMSLSHSQPHEQPSLQAK